MTIAFSGISHRLIVVTVDSAVTLQFCSHREYQKGRKVFFYEGVGCVATWGARVRNNIDRYLGQFRISPETHSIEDLRALVKQYLKGEYRPHEEGLDDVGYHVAGFDKKGNPRFYHEVWGWE